MKYVVLSKTQINNVTEVNASIAKVIFSLLVKKFPAIAKKFISNRSRKIENIRKQFARRLANATTEKQRKALRVARDLAVDAAKEVAIEEAVNFYNKQKEKKEEKKFKK